MLKRLQDELFHPKYDIGRHFHPKSDVGRPANIEALSVIQNTNFIVSPSDNS